MKGNGHLFAFDLNDALSIQEILLLYVMCLLCSFNYGGFLNRMVALTGTYLHIKVMILHEIVS